MNELMYPKSSFNVLYFSFELGTVSSNLKVTISRKESQCIFRGIYFIKYTFLDLDRYAELSKEEKSKISHRFRAIEKMIEHFKE